jgi:hypothetical protein
MLALAVLATLPHSNDSLDGLLGSASMIYSRFLCASSGAQQDGVVGCASGGFTKWDALRLPPNTNLLIYGPSLVREIAQLLLHAEQSSPYASITLISGDAAVDPGGAQQLSASAARLLSSAHRATTLRLGSWARIAG